MEHELNVHSLKPCRATCSCGKWEITEDRFADDEKDEGQRSDWVRYDHRRHVETVEKEHRLAKFRTLAQQIALSLKEWTYQEREPKNDDDMHNEWHRSRAYLKGPDGACLVLHYGEYKKPHITVSGEYPSEGGTTYPYHDRQPGSINVSPDREPSTIAKDIMRRFVPAYLEAYAKGREQLDKHVAFEKGRKEVLDRLAKVLGEKPWQDKTICHHCENPGLKIDTRIEVQVNGSDSVKVEFSSLTPGQAEGVIATVMGPPKSLRK